MLIFVSIIGAIFLFAVYKTCEHIYDNHEYHKMIKTREELDEELLQKWLKSLQGDE